MRMCFVTMMVYFLLIAGQNGVELCGKSLLGEMGGRIMTAPVSKPARLLFVIFSLYNLFAVCAIMAVISLTRDMGVMSIVVSIARRQHPLKKSFHGE